MEQPRHIEEYLGKSKDELLGLKQEMEGRRDAAIEKWKEIKLTGSIVMTVFGAIFIWLLPLSIPLLICGIKGIVRKGKERNRWNREIDDANLRIFDIEEAMKEAKE